jgi:YHS domain-containing protein
MKNYLSVFALSMLVAHASSGTMNHSEFDTINADLQGPNLGSTRVWVEKSARRANVDSNGVILKGYDVVAYFTQDKAIKGSSKYQTTYEGAIYYFSSATDLTAFSKNPSKYVPQYGAFCANGVKNQHLVDSDPTVFFFAKGKLYVCSSPSTQKEFRVRSIESIIQADRNWYQMIH